METKVSKTYHSQLAIIVAAIAFFSGCKKEEFIACTLEARAGIQVEVRDSLTGKAAAFGVVGFVQDDQYVDTLRIVGWQPNDPSAHTMVAAYERRGTYTVVLRKAGYREWVRSNILVGGDECHVNTVSLTALLERL